MLSRLARILILQSLVKMDKHGRPTWKAKHMFDTKQKNMCQNRKKKTTSRTYSFMLESWRPKLKTLEPLGTSRHYGIDGFLRKAFRMCPHLVNGRYSLFKQPGQNILPVWVGVMETVIDALLSRAYKIFEILYTFYSTYVLIELHYHKCLTNALTRISRLCNQKIKTTYS